MSKLYVVEGPLRGKTFEVTELASIGRGESCAVRLDGHHISRIHARLERRGDTMFVKDNGSRNGIFVNGQNVKESALRPDDLIEIGEHVLVFEPTGDPDKRFHAAATVLETLADPFAPGDPDERLQKILGVAASLVAMEDEKEIARHLLEALMVAVPSERGFVMIADDSGQLKPGARKAPAGDEDFYLSNVLSRQLRERRGVIAVDVLRRQPNLGKPIGILAVPLAAKSGFHGLVYLDAKLAEGETRPRFRPGDLKFAAGLAAFAGARLGQLTRLVPSNLVGKQSLTESRTAFEKEFIVEALHQKGGDLDATAKILGLTRATLDEKLKLLNLVANPTSASSKETAVKPKETKPPQEANWKSVQT
jgi:hypothetical protein